MGWGSVLLFEGAAGMGRSSVLTALRQFGLQRGMEILTATRRQDRNRRVA
jgi:hypothetical protein